MSTNGTAKDTVFEARIRGFDLKFHTTAGLFSYRQIDPGTQMLIDEIEISASDRVLDVGCGYGAIGVALAKLAPEGEVHLVDKDFVAIEYAQKNIAENHITNARAYLSNGLNQVQNDVRFQIIASNIPAHVGNEILESIIRDARARLVVGGKLYIVSVTRLNDYFKRNFKQIIGNYKSLKHNAQYTVALAVKE